MKKRQIKVLVVDDSAFIRVLLTQILENDSEIKVVGTAEDPFDAREKIKKYNPDVLTLDVEMPKMDGITFLKNIMRLRPMPVIMVSTLTHAGAEVTMQALTSGAFDFVAKPSSEVKEKLQELADDLIEKVKAAAHCNAGVLEKSPEKPQTNLEVKQDRHLIDLIAIGASTGGTEAIHSIVTRLPDNLPPIVMAQHIPDVFSTSYAKRLHNESKMVVQEVRSPQKLSYGHAYLAPGHMHMTIKVKGRGNNRTLWADLSDADPVNRHKPSVDVLFDSVAEAVGSRCIATLLTGMGQDGAQGLLNLKQCGATTIAQNEETSVVWGMPGAAVKLGAADKILALGKIGGYLISRL
ncbi:chemotaxis response regulator protein-glutamate methylesterase [Aliikangiella coralliicola]|uniref:Protein-glutamate methylesterase/protein-glutamine glutaminase n=2 Tax=Aliikangiella coralliicola TaxID=2592383 RepID=A0A545UBD0_9GAMM|nr:chemotaxis response regulator protein-glutamate methylesterase [Aliikangiella coralliicola]